jgi:hypothetical protein
MSAKCLAGALIVLLLASTGWAATALLPIVTHDGRSCRAHAGGRLQSKRARRRPRSSRPRQHASAAARGEPGRRTLTRNWSQVLVNGKPVVLDAPVRVKARRVAGARSLRRPDSADPGGERRRARGARSRPRRPRSTWKTCGSDRIRRSRASSSRRRRPSRIASSRADPRKRGAARRPRKRRAQSGDR